MPGTSTLAYFASAPVTKMKRFIKLATENQPKMASFAPILLHGKKELSSWPGSTLCFLERE
jgi:hypothetical protein